MYLRLVFIAAMAALHSNTLGQEQVTLIPNVIHYEITLPNLVAGTKSEVTIGIVNRLGKTITVKEIRSSCGCLGGKLDPKEIVPDGIASLSLIVSSPASSDRFTNQLKLELDDQLEPEIVLNIQSNLDNLFVVRPNAVLPTQNSLIKVRTTTNCSILDISALPGSRFIRNISIESISEDRSLATCKVEFSDRCSSLSSAVNERFGIRYTDVNSNVPKFVVSEIQLSPVSKILVSPDHPVFAGSDADKPSQIIVIKSSLGLGFESLRVVSLVNAIEYPVEVEILKESQAAIVARLSLSERVDCNGVLKFFVGDYSKEVAFSLSKFGD